MITLALFTCPLYQLEDVQGMMHARWLWGAREGSGQVYEMWLAVRRIRGDRYLLRVAGMHERGA